MKHLLTPVFIHRLKYLAGYALVIAFIAACTTQAANPPKESETVVFKGIPVDAAIVTLGKSNDQLVVTGTILANQEVSLVSELTRKITGIYVREGSMVKKGAVLFELDRADLIARLERLQQQEKLALLNETRLKDLIAKEAVAQQDYDEASTDLNVLQAEIRELNVMIDKTRITAPFDGQVGMINIHVGAVVSVNTVLAQLEDNSVVKVEFAVPEKYTNIIHIGSEERFTTPADEREYKTKIVAKAASLSTDTRTLMVRGIVANPDGKLLPGQSARINLSLNTSSTALAVSSHALIPSTGGYTVFVSRNNTATAIPVQIGQRSTGTVEIVSGLNPGDTIITSNLLRLGTGTPVDLVSIH
jgi:membrane fusion protein (multidrug efflux system)